MGRETRPLYNLEEEPSHKLETRKKDFAHGVSTYTQVINFAQIKDG